MALLPPFGSAQRPVVRRLGLSDAEAFSALIKPQALQHAFLSGWVHRHGLIPSTPGMRFDVLGLERAGRLEGVCLVVGGEWATLAADTREAGEAFAAQVRRDGFRPRLVHGPPPAVGGFAAAREFPEPEARLIGQQVRVLTSRELRYVAAPELRRATLFDLEEVLEASLRMHVEEMGEHLVGASVDHYRSGLAQQIADDRVWCVRDPIRGGLLYKAAIADSGPEAALLEGVWTAPESRRRGVARAATGELCRRLLRAFENVVLHTGEDNAAAARLYDGLGFRVVGSSTLAVLRPGVAVRGAAGRA